MNFIIRILITGAIAFALSRFLDGIEIDKYSTAVIFALVLAVLNAIVKPILILLTLPVTIVTLGLFLFVINALIILMASGLINGIKVDGFWWALIFSLILSVLTSLLYSAIDKKDK